MQIPITALYAGLLALLSLYLSFRTGGTMLITVAAAVYSIWLIFAPALG